MTIDQLTEFQAVAKCENVSQAAEQLFISQSALSKSLRRLENELGVQLFDRNGKTVSLNPKGKLVLSFTDTILKEVQEMQEALSESRKEEHILRVGANLPNIVRFCIPKAQKEWKEQKLKGTYYNLEHMDTGLLRKGLHDVLISSVQPEEEPGMDSMLLCVDHMGVCLPPGSPLSEKDRLRLDDLAGMQAVFPETVWDSHAIRLVFQQMKKREIRMKCRQVMDLAAMEFLFHDSEFITFSSELTCRYYVPAMRKYVPLDEPELQIPYFIIYPEKNAARAEPLAAWLEKEFCSSYSNPS